MASGGTTQFNLEINTKANLEGVNQLKTALKEIQTAASSGTGFATGKSASELNQMVTSAKSLQYALTAAFDTKLGVVNLQKFNNALKTCGTDINQIKTGLMAAGSQGQKAFLQMTSQILKASTATKQCNTFVQKMSTTFLNTVRWQVTSSILNTMVGSFSKMYNYVKDLDQSLNNIQIVTDKSAEDMEKFAKSANEAAQNLGTKTTTFTDAALIYYQQGLGDEEALARTETTVKMANVMGETASTVSDYMTAIWNNFEDGSHTVEYFADVITNLGAHTASSAEEIAEGLEKFASVADTVGLSYEYATTALATVVAQTRQSADTVGTAFKTLFARIQDLELGETLDDGTTLGTYSQALEKVGINIKDQQGELKDMNTILDEMGEKWQSLSKDQQVALAQNVAGTRQYTQLVALMDNWDTFNKNLEIANDSEGRLAEEQETYMESVKAHIQELNAAVEELYTNILSSGDINNVVDLGTKIVKVVNQLVTSLGGLKGILPLVASLMLKSFGSQIANSMLISIKNLELTKEKAMSVAEQYRIIGELSPKLANAMGPGMASGVTQVDQAAKELINTYEKFQPLFQYMSEEELNQYNALMDQKAAVGGIVAEMSELSTASSGKGLLSVLGGSNFNDIDKLEVKLGTITAAASAFDDKTIKLNANLQNWEPNIVKAREAITEWENALQSAGIEVDDFYKKYNNVVTRASNGQIISVNVKGFREATQALSVSSKEAQDLTLKLNLAKASVEGLGESVMYMNALFERSVMTMTQFISQISMLAVNIGTITNIVKTLGNEEMSAGEKAISVLTSVSFMIPMIISSITNLLKVGPQLFTSFATILDRVTTALTKDDTSLLTKQIAAQVALNKARKTSLELKEIDKATDSTLYAEKEKILNQEREELIAKLELTGLTHEAAVAKAEDLLANEASIVSNDELTASIYRNIAAQLKWLVTTPAGWAVLATAAVVSLTVAILALNTAQDRAVEKMNERAEDLADRYETAKDAFDELVASWEEYETAIEATYELTKGTIDYADAVEDANEKAQELIDTYEELEGHYSKNQNGLIIFDDTAEDFINTKEKQTNTLSLAANQAKNDYYNASFNRNTNKDLYSSGDTGLNTADIKVLTEAFVASNKKVNNTYDIAKILAESKYGENVTNDEISELKTTLDQITEYNPDYIDTVNELIQSNSDIIESQNLLKDSIERDAIGSSNYGEDFNELSDSEQSYLLNKVDLTNTDTYNEALAQEQSTPVTKEDIQDYIVNTLGGEITKTGKFGNKFSYKIGDTEYTDVSKKDLAKELRETNAAITAANAEITEDVINNQKEMSDKITSAAEDADSTFDSDYIIQQVYAALEDQDAGVLSDILLSIPEDKRQTFIDNISTLVDKADAEAFENMTSQAMATAQESESDYYENAANQAATYIGSLQEIAELKHSDKELTDKEKEALAEEEAAVEELAQQYGLLNQIKNGTEVEQNAGYRELSNIEEAEELNNLYKERDALYSELNKKQAQQKEIEEEIADTEEWLNNETDGEIKSALESSLSDLYLQKDAITDSIQTQLQEIADQDYSIEVEVDAKIDSDIEDGFDIADDFASLKDTIKDDLQITVDEAQEIIEAGYGEMLQGAKGLTDGTIQLQSQAVNSYIDGQQTELDTEKQAKIQQLELEKQSLEAQRAILVERGKYLEKATEAETANEAAGALASAEILAEEYDAEQEALATKLDNNALADQTMSENATNLYNFLNDAYNTDAENAADADASADAAAETYQQNVIDYYKAMHTAVKEYAAAVMAAENGEDIPDFDVDYAVGDNVNRGGTTGTSVDDKYESHNSETVSFNKIKDAIINQVGDNLEDIKQVAKQQLAENDSQINSIDAQIGAIDASIAAMNAGSASVDTRQANPSSSSSNGSGSDGSGSSSQKDYADYTDDFDRFHDFTQAIEETERALEKLQDQEEHVFGDELVENLKDQTAELDKQRQLYQDLADARWSDLVDRQAALSQMGVTFDTEGQISNYNAATVAWNNKYNEAVSQYNSGAISEEQFDAIETQYELFKDYISAYDDAYDEWQEDTDKVDELVQEMRDNILKQITVQVEFNVDQADIQRQLIEAASDIPVHFDVDGNEIGDFTLQYGKLPGEATSLANQMYQYTKDDGDIATYKAQVDLYQSELDKINAGGTSSMFASASEAQNALDEAKVNYANSLSDAYSLWEDVYNKYIDGIDEGADRLEEVMKEYENLSKTLEHAKTMSELLYGENDYDNQLAIGESQQSIDLATMDSYKQQAAMWNKYYLKAVEDGDEVAAAKYKELYQDAIDELYESEETYIQDLLDEYATKVKKTFSDLEKEMTGGSNFDWMSEQWDLTKEAEDGNYDDVERVYQIDKISNAYENLIKSNSGNLKIQQKIKAQMDAEVEALENKTELSEYDVELAEKHLSVLEAEAALEDAQNNKNTMKLSRDTSGNWSYQYVADDADIAEKEQALADAQNEAYEYAKEGWQDVEEQLIETQQTALETIQAIEEKMVSATDEEKAMYQAQLDWYENYYYGENGRIAQLSAESAERELNYKTETMAAISEYYRADVDNYSLMTTDEQNLLDTLKANQIQSASDVYAHVAGEEGTYAQMYAKAEEVLGDTEELWSTSAATIVRKWYSDEDSVSAMVKKALDDCGVAQDTFDKKVEDGTDAAGEDYTDLKDTYIAPVDEKIADLANTTETTCDDIESDLSALYGTYETTIEYWNQIGEAELDAARKAAEYASAAVAAAQQVAAANALAAAAAGSTTSTGSGGSTGGTTAGTTPTSKTYTIYYKNGNIMGSGSSPKAAIPAICSTWSSDQLNASNYIISNGTTKKPNQSISSIRKMSAFDTGGYTGSWGSDGKLGILHQKELVLNADDTPNILEAVSAVRDLSGLGSNISNAIVDNISSLMSNILTGKVGDISTNTNTNTSDNVFNITAEFPNANDVTEIREAILSLPNLASQYLGRR